MVLFMIQAKEVAIIGPASFRSRHEMLSLFGDNLPCNFKTSMAEVCCKLNVVETGFMYESKLVFPLGNVEARVGPTDVKWSLKISHVSAGFVELSPLLVHLLNNY